MTAAQLQATGIVIDTTASVVGVGILLYRFSKFLDNPSYHSFASFLVDVAFSYGGLYIGAALLGSSFVGILIGIYLSYLISKKMSYIIDAIASFIKYFLLVEPVRYVITSISRIFKRSHVA